MATIIDTTTNANGDIIINVSSSVDDAITLATAETYSDKNIIFNITMSEELANAVNTALAQAKASGEFDGQDGKSAYQHAQDGGYTGTETAFNTALGKVDSFQEKGTLVASTMTAAGWNSATKTYSFETDYPNASYDIEIDFDYDNGTTEQYESYCGAQLGGSASGNKVKAMGDVPTIDIPIVVYVTAKQGVNNI